MATIIGADAMARGIGARFVAGGESVTLVDRDPAKAQQVAEQIWAAADKGATVTTAAFGSPITDDIVVLALPYSALNIATLIHGLVPIVPITTEFWNIVQLAGPAHDWQRRASYQEASQQLCARCSSNRQLDL